MNSLDWFGYLVGLAAITNPISALPLIAACTPDFKQKQIFMAATASAFIYILATTLALLSGEGFLRLMGTSLPSFEIGGGLLLFLVGLSMARGGNDDAKGANDSECEGRNCRTTLPLALGCVPFGLPMAAGPGALTKVIVQSNQTPDWESMILIFAANTVVAALVFLIYGFSRPLSRLLGGAGMSVLTRVFGLITIAVGIELVIRGLDAHIVSMGLHLGGASH